MIISEKQIMQLITIARNASDLAMQKQTKEWMIFSSSVCSLLDNINDQQSEKLKEITYDC